MTAENRKEGPVLLEYETLSPRHTIRRLSEADADAILSLCLENTQYYAYCGKQPSRALILEDLILTPPGKDLSDKYYLGFYDGPVLIAVMDLIDGYPAPETAFIGFFMMRKALQGRQIGSGLIEDVCESLKARGFASVRLGIDKGNPQSTHFWKKNGFAVIREIEQDGWTVLLAEKTL